MPRYPLVEAKCGGTAMGIGLGDEDSEDQELGGNGTAGKRLLAEQTVAGGGADGSWSVNAAGAGAGGGMRAVFSVTHKHNITIAINDEPVDKIRMKCTSPFSEEPPRYGKWRFLDACRTPLAALSLNLLALILGVVAPSTSARAAIVWLSSLACTSATSSPGVSGTSTPAHSTHLAPVLIVLLGATYAVSSALTPLLVRRTSLKLVLLSAALLVPLAQLPMLSSAPLCVAPGALLVGATLGPLALSGRLYLAAFERVYRPVFRGMPRTLAVAIALAHAALSTEHLLVNLLFAAALPGPTHTTTAPLHYPNPHPNAAGSVYGAGASIDTQSFDWGSGAIATDEFSSTSNDFALRQSLTTRVGSPTPISSMSSDPLLARCSKDVEGTALQSLFAKCIKYSIVQRQRELHSNSRLGTREAEAQLKIELPESNSPTRNREVLRVATIRTYAIQEMRVY